MCHIAATVGLTRPSRCPPNKLRQVSHSALPFGAIHSVLGLQMRDPKPLLVEETKIAPGEYVVHRFRQLRSCFRTKRLSVAIPPAVSIWVDL